ncbi:cell division protein ZapA [Sphingomonas quercus]|uniref:Cell division protein ZapA n=1 Tax=Sphingomonas quercus TaxID=2842451 RepID=A0ABS6BPI3_9SPHN|nr:cell division protein ZapA [Sphingomonas quercus]
MNRISLDIAGHRYDIACRAGQEGHFLGLARVIENKVAQATDAMGRMDATRQLLFAALLLADELGEARASAVETGAALDDATFDRLETIAVRLERLAAG